VNTDDLAGEFYRQATGDVPPDDEPTEDDLDDGEFLASSSGTLDEAVTHLGQLRSQPLGERLAREQLRGKFIYAREIGWHRWDGTRWKRSHEDDVIREAHRFVIGLIKQLVDGQAEDATITAVLRYRETGNLSQLVRAARTVPSIVVEADKLDAYPGLLNCANGTVDLRTGRLLPHDPARLITKTTGVAYRAEATHADWDKALTALPDDKTREWVQEHMGSAATGETDRDCPVVFHKGLGENGKSTVIGAVVSTLSEYAALVPDKLLTGGDNGHETVWMPLRGARLAYLEELPEEHVLPVARIKKLASTPQITAREIGKNNVTWDATHVLIVSTNYFPRVNETDHGTWRRLAMVDYPHKFTGKAKDVRLKARLRTGKGQREAVLAWLVEGAKRWYASGGDLGVIPQSVADSTMEWRTEGDELGKFLAERVKVTGNLEDRLTTKDVLDHFNVWLDANGNRPWSTTLLGQRLRSHHFVTDNPQVTYDRGDRGRQATGLTGARWASWP
jgi:P4 family phage/plasmid primase-like protien